MYTSTKQSYNMTIYQTMNYLWSPKAASGTIKISSEFVPTPNATMPLYLNFSSHLLWFIIIETVSWWKSLSICCNASSTWSFRDDLLFRIHSWCNYLFYNKGIPKIIMVTHTLRLKERGKKQQTTDRVGLKQQHQRATTTRSTKRRKKKSRNHRP